MLLLEATWVKNVIYMHTYLIFLLKYITTSLILDQAHEIKTIQYSLSNY